MEMERETTLINDRYVKLRDLKNHRSRPAPSTLEKLHYKGEDGGVVVLLDGVLTVDLVELDLWQRARFEAARKRAYKDGLKVKRPRGRLKAVLR